MKQKPSLLREMLSVIATALVLSIIVRTFVFQAFYVPSESMENTLLKNDRIVVNKVSTKITGIHRGDVIVFHDPGGWLGEGFPNPYDTTIGRILQFIGIVPANSGNDLVKRVVGVGNDTLECCDVNGHILVNGRAVTEGFIKPDNGTDQVAFKVIVPEGRVFVMGDNRGNSEDSRFHLDKNNGMVPVSDIVGRVSMKVWPISRFGGIER